MGGMRALPPPPASSIASFSPAPLHNSRGIDIPRTPFGRSTSTIDGSTSSGDRSQSRQGEQNPNPFRFWRGQSLDGSSLGERNQNRSDGSSLGEQNQNPFNFGRGQHSGETAGSFRLHMLGSRSAAKRLDENTNIRYTDTEPKVTFITT
jgi:hypothetical protein